MPPVNWLAAPTSALVFGKLGAVMSPLVTCGVIVVPPKRAIQVPAVWENAACAVSARAAVAMNFKVFFMVFSVQFMGLQPTGEDQFFVYQLGHKLVTVWGEVNAIGKKIVRCIARDEVVGRAN